MMGVNGPLGTIALARLGASGTVTPDAVPGALEAGAAAEEGATALPTLPELLEVPEVLGVIGGLDRAAQPASPAISTTMKSDVTFMGRNRKDRALAVACIGLIAGKPCVDGSGQRVTRIKQVCGVAGIMGQAPPESDPTVSGAARKIAGHLPK